MTEKIRAPRFAGEGRIVFEEKPSPKPGHGELLIKVQANALCGSERGQFQHGANVTPGHEAAGVVAAAGPRTSVPVGTPGVIYLMVFCGRCRSCRQGFTNQCLDRRGDMGFNRDGGYGPYAVVPERIFFPTAPDVSGAEATLLLDIMGTGGHALGRASLVHPDIASILVAGAGPIGLGVLAMARLTFGESVPVFITDMVPYRLALAEKLGGRPIDLREGTLEESLRRHGAERVDVAVDTTGKGAARQASLAALHQRGVLVCVGHGEGLSLDVSADLIAPERAVLGSEYFRFEELSGNLALLRAHRAYLSQIITHRYLVEKIEEAFRTFFSGETGKVVIEQ